MSQKILVADDEKNIVDLISYNLKKEGYGVIAAHDGKAALDLALNSNPDLVILDIMMPKLDGFDVCRKIREKSQVPIVMLTARAEEIDKVLGLGLGADDYVTKPFGVRELMARVKANLRKRANTTAAEEASNVLRFGDISIDVGRYEVERRGVSINLTRREFELIKFLAVAKSQVFSREALLEKVWGYEYFGDVRTVDVTIRRLRSKVEDNPDRPRYILTKRGVGYYFNEVDGPDEE